MSINSQVPIMRKFAPWLISIVTAVLASCGGGSADAFRTAPPAGTAALPVASIAVASSAANIPSDGSATATITAYVRDSGNRLLSGVTVTFSSDSGALQVRTAVSGTDGAAVASLSTPGNGTLRTINVTASATGSAGTFSASTAVQVTAAQPPAVVGSLTLVSSTPTVPSNSSLNADITAFVRDATNRFMPNIPVVFTATSGGLTVVTATTTAAGSAAATLNAAGDPTNRTITVTATAQAVTATVAIAVSGTRLTLQGPSSAVLNQVVTYQVSLTDSGNAGIGGRTITVASAAANALSATSIVTDTQGRGSFTVTVTHPTNDTLTISGLGLTATQVVAVNSDSFSISTPATEGFEIPLSTPQTLTLHWLQANVPFAGQTINFSSTRGTLSSSTAVTNASGDATVSVSSTNAGIALVTASSGAATATRSVEFVAQTATAIDIQPAVFSIAPNQQTTLTAVVRDAANNLVKNKTVSFSLQDVTGGTLSTASAVTNSQGTAQTVYSAASTSSALNGVTITATVAGAAGPISKSVSITVAQLALFISLGTGNSIIKSPDATQYTKQYAVQVTDANGNGVSGVNLTMSLFSTRYVKGVRVFAANSWAHNNHETDPQYLTNWVCPDEDRNHNGVLDPGEDDNGDGILQAGNVALATPGSLVTNSTGFAVVNVVYPEEYAYWVEVALSARASVQGTEFQRTSIFFLPGADADFNTQTTSPPGPVSPFGTNICSVPR